jgi:hypothetical protein
MTNATTRHRRDLAERVRHACLTAAGDAYEDAGLRGLCAEGRWECARQAVADLDLDVLIRDETSSSSFEAPADRDSGSRA